MKNMTLQNIADACNGQLVGTATEKTVNGVVIDSRQVEPGFLFLAVKGEKVDGHKFIPDVFEKGAACVVCEDLPQNPAGPCIQVENTLQALKDIAEFYRKQLSIPVVGITGSVGKTSTKEFIASVLETKYKVLKTELNYNNEIGVPLMICKIREEHEVAVLEMGINHFGEMHRLSKMARPDYCVMTNIGQCHLEYLGTRDGILKAKSEIFDYMAEDGTVLINGDDDKLRTIEQVHGKKPVTFGMNPSAAFYARDIQSNGLLGTDTVLCTEEETIPVHIPLPGEHMVLNALAAAGIGKMLGLTADQIAEGIASVKAVGGRSHVIGMEDKVVVDDCYNANPVSMKAAIDLLDLAKGRRVALLGDMFELGEQEKEMHGQIGTYAAEKSIDLLLCVGELSKNMYEAAMSAGMKKAYWYPDKESLLEQWNGLLEPGDTILVKASHGMGFAKLVEELSSLQL